MVRDVGQAHCADYFAIHTDWNHDVIYLKLTCSVSILCQLKGKWSLVSIES